MTIRTISYDTPTERIIEDIVFSYAKLKAHPKGAPHAPAFKAKLDEATQLILTELNQSVRKYSAQALIEYVDDNLNDLVDSIDNATNTKSESLQRLRGILFGNKAPSIFKKPVLGAQLTAQRAWLGPLRDASMPETIQAFANPLEAYAKAADEALQERASAAQEVRDFKTVGARVKFTDALNSLRKSTFIALDQLREQDPSLPRDFASRFFLKRSNNYAHAETLEEEMKRLQDRAEVLQEELATIKVRLTQIEEERSKQAAEESARQAADEEVAAAERHLQELKARRARL